MDWISPKMDDILWNREKMEEAVDGINVDFEIAAFVASIEGDTESFF